jgi:hypothetical protein
MSSQLAMSETWLLASPSDVSAVANNAFDPGNTFRPPKRSMSLPERGPRKPEISSPHEKAMKIHGVPTRSSRAMELARMAGR